MPSSGLVLPSRRLIYSRSTEVQNGTASAVSLTFLFASSREALQATLGSTSDITEDELYGWFNFILNDASGGDTPNQPDQMGAKKRHPGGVASKKASIQKENPPSRSDNTSDNTTRRKGWIMMPALRKLHRIGLWLRNSSIHCNA
ncbi:hypothetical protein B0J15DRAFT_468338 [Fusarium solani]|uniref:Uncharacterized protein n=1 Tax=Fusarium solani TaxID=169388 RepID=A0A9P9GZC0_FUSSL|nr:uncharacterized protein B0J15DRAFT_468338 [Fusarium solani]KAH7248328.1 hypothetical protein B0J15DRAFT_468338 [Fusarium solani]